MRTQHPKRNIYQGKEDSKLVVDTPANRNIDPRVDALTAAFTSSLHRSATDFDPFEQIFLENVRRELENEFY